MEQIRILFDEYKIALMNEDFDNIERIGIAILDEASSQENLEQYFSPLWYAIHGNRMTLVYKVDEKPIDTMIDYWTAFFIKQENRARLSNNSYEKIIVQLIHANIQIHSLTSALELYSAIFDILNLHDLTSMLVSFFKRTYSILDSEKHIIPWKNRVDEYLRKAKVSKPNDLKSVSKIISENYEYIHTIDKNWYDEVMHQLKKLNKRYNSKTPKTIYYHFFPKKVATPPETPAQLLMKYARDNLAETTELVSTLSYTSEEICEKLTSKHQEVKEKIENYTSFYDYMKLFELLYYLKLQLRKFEIHVAVNNEVEKVPNPQKYDEVFFLANINSINFETMLIPITIYARKRNIRTVPIYPHPFNFEPSNDYKLDRLARRIHRTIDQKHPSKKLYYDWKIDLKNKFIGFEQINCYQVIYEFVTRIQYNFFLNENCIFTNVKIAESIRILDTKFRYLEELNAWALKSKKKSYIIGTSYHFTNGAAPRIFCESHLNTANIEYIGVNPGYENYFSNMKTFAGQSISCLNLTKNLDSRATFLGTKQGFENFFKETAPIRETQLAKVNEWISLNRASKKASDHNDMILNLINEYKQKNKKVFLALGKVVFDLAVKDTKGIIHSDMSDWITNTVDLMKSSDNLLLIKPHPHEENYMITLSQSKSTKFTDLIKTELPKNVIVLDSQKYKTSDLNHLVDAVLMWNGTSCLEQAAQKKPIFAFDTWAFKDYPINLYKIPSKEAYNALLQGEIPNYNLDELSLKAGVFLNYMGSNETMAPANMIKYSTVNLHYFSEFAIYPDKVDEYIKHGNKQLDTMFDKARGIL